MIEFKSAWFDLPRYYPDYPKIILFRNHQRLQNKNTEQEESNWQLHGQMTTGLLAILKKYLYTYTFSLNNLIRYYGIKKLYKCQKYQIGVEITKPFSISHLTTSKKLTS